MTETTSPPRDKVLLYIQAPDDATELQVIDSAYQPVQGGRGWGRLGLRVEPGLYKLKFRLGTTLEEELHEVPAGKQRHQVKAPALKLFTPAPLGRAMGVRAEHQEAARRHSREVHARLGSGSQLFVFAHAVKDGQGRSPASGLSLCTVDGRELLSFADVGESNTASERPWAACNVELQPGAYVLKTALGGTTLAQVVVTGAGMQTSVFLGPPPSGLSDTAVPPRLDPANAAIFVSAPGFEPESEDPVLTEAARLCLSEGRPVAPVTGDLHGWTGEGSMRPIPVSNLGPSEFFRSTPGGPISPMQVLFKACSVLLEEQPGRMLQTHIRYLRTVFGKGGHPDVESLAFEAAVPEVASIRVPPMMQLRWPRVVRESLRRKDLIPADSLTARAGRSLWGSGVWLLWSEEHGPRDALLPFASGPAELTPLESAALELAPRRKAAPSTLPRWVEEREPVARLSSETVARALQLPASVAEETLKALRSKLELAQRAVVSRRCELLASPKAPLCAVIIPEGVKEDPTGLPPIDFDALYSEAIEPALGAAGLAAFRISPGLLRFREPSLRLCQYIVAELTTREVRDALLLSLLPFLPGLSDITLLLARHHRPPGLALPFGETLEYELGEAAHAKLGAALSQRLQAHREPLKLSPEDAHALAGLREELVSEERCLASLAKARERGDGGQSLRELEEQVRAMVEPSPELELGFLFSYRSFSAWDDMVRVVEELPPQVQALPVVQTQLAFALNRRSEGRLLTEDRRRAIQLLTQSIDTSGPAPESCGILGRIYKDLWEESQKAKEDAHEEMRRLVDLEANYTEHLEATLREIWKDSVKAGEDASEYLDRAIDSYTRGFESDWREPYPGINAVTLLEVRGDRASLVRKEQLLPVVRFAVEQRLRGSRPGYWEYATMLELAVLEGRQELARRLLYSARACIRERFEPETTARNLSMIVRARELRQEPVDWIIQLRWELTG